MDMQEMNEFDLSGIDINDLPSLPEYAVVPPGTYSASMTLEKKLVKVEGKPNQRIVNANFKNLVPKSFANGADLDSNPEFTAKENDLVSIRHDLSYEMAMGNLKKILAAMAPTFGTNDMQALIDQAQDVQVTVDFAKKANKKKNPSDEQTYSNQIKLISVS